jgi:thiol-disulfide isomerase/thioredoxin
VLASTVELEAAGNPEYQNDHMAKILEDGFSFSGFERDKLYLSDRGERFVDISGLSGVDAVSDGRGAAYADFDNDGDSDIFLTSLQGQAHHLFRNDVGQHRGFLRVTLHGRDSGNDAYGAQVRVKTSQGVLARIKAGGSGFVSQSDPRLLFGLGDDDSAQWLEVHWPSGLTQRFGAIAAGSSVLIREGSAELEYLQERRFSLPDPLAADALVHQALRPRLGEQFPSLTLTDLQGIKLESSDLSSSSGRPLVVNLWATWCVPCRAEMPQLEKLYPKLQAAGVDLIGISVDVAEARRKIPSYLKRIGISYPSYTTDESSLELLYSGDQLFVPITFILDGDFRVIEILSGWNAKSEARLHSLLE